MEQATSDGPTGMLRDGAGGGGKVVWETGSIGLPEAYRKGGTKPKRHDMMINSARWR